MRSEWFVVTLALTAVFFPSLSRCQAIPEEAIHHTNQLTAENNVYRGFRRELGPRETAEVGHITRDEVLIVLCESGTELTVRRADSSIEKLLNGNVRFLAAGTTAQVQNGNGDKAQIIIIELKKHWDDEMRPCAAPRNCSHVIRIGDQPIGETTDLFTNGFVTVQQHRLSRGGTLTSSYFSATGKHHLFFTALSELHASFDGNEEELTRGETSLSDASQVEISAGKGEARWVVIRVQDVS